MRKVKILDSAFTPFGNSASLREENENIHPAYFQWDTIVRNPSPAFFTDGHLSDVTEWMLLPAKKVAWLLEPSHLRPENYEHVLRNYGLFDCVLTYDKQLLDDCEIARAYPFGGSSIAFDKWGMYPKTKNVCMILSDKQTTEGHKLRHQIAKEFGDRIDLYGAGIGKPFDSKFEILKDYKYCVVVESGRSDFYFTEKLIDPISVGTLPVYWGCPSIDKFLSVRSFKDLEELSRIITRLKNYPSDYLHYKRIAGAFENVFIKNIKEAEKYRIAEDWIYNEYPDLFE